MKKGKLKEPAFAYLKELDSIPNLKCKGKSMEYFIDLDNIDEALKVNLCLQLNSILKKMGETKASKKDFINSIQALNIVKFARDHINYVTFLLFKDRATKSTDIKCPQVFNILRKLCMIYGLNHLNKDALACYQSGYFSGQPYHDLIIEAIKEINREIRPLAIPIMESVDLPDEMFPSAIGNSYGDIYE